MRVCGICMYDNWGYRLVASRGARSGELVLATVIAASGLLAGRIAMPQGNGSESAMTPLRFASPESHTFVALSIASVLK